MRPLAISILAAVVVFITPGGLADEARPPREASSENGRFLLRIEPGRPGRAGRNCIGALYHQPEPGRRGRRVWERALVNDAAPVRAFVSNDGRFVVTLDEYRRGGARNAVVIYGEAGELLRHFLLTDLLRKEDWKNVRVERRELVWSDGARCGFDEQNRHFGIETRWGKRLTIDLRTLQVVSGEDSGAQTELAAVPAEFLAVLLSHFEPEEGEDVARHIADQTPADEAEEVAGELTPDQHDLGLSGEESAPTDEIASVEQEPVAPPQDEPVTEQVAPEEQQTADAAAVEAEPAEVAERQPPVVRDVPPEYRYRNEALPGQNTAGVPVPAPDPVHKTDYVAWLNELGQVDGPDARWVYEAAAERFVPFSGDEELYEAAESGDPDALLSPEIGAWLAENEGALATFSEAALYPDYGWDLGSESGALLEVMLPHLSPMRNLARTSVLSGRRLLAEGQPAAAADRYLTALGAGSHAGEGVTLIENLVGTAIHSYAGEALLDMEDQAAADELDYEALAVQMESAYRPVRDPAVAVQGERAFFMDCAQRIWDVDQDSGTTVFNREAARELFSGGVLDEDLDTDQVLDELAGAGYDEVVLEGSLYYDALTEAFEQPYAVGAQQIEQLESLLQDSETSNPFLRHLTPSLKRYHLVTTRGEANRRAALLITNLHAYRQQFGEYPQSLDAFSEREFALDPFSSAGFVYRRDGDGFELYSVGANGLDDGGVHDRRGEVNDIRYWPRPYAEPRE